MPNHYNTRLCNFLLQVNINTKYLFNLAQRHHQSSYSHSVMSYERTTKKENSRKAMQLSASFMNPRFSSTTQDVYYGSSMTAWLLINVYQRGYEKGLEIDPNNQ